MRQDIQCLRGVAILFVLIFHLQPLFFVNGFLGVDISFISWGLLVVYEQKILIGFLIFVPIILERFVLMSWTLIQFYFQFLADGSSLNAFIHLWSLGVEMQFYLLVPFIFFGLQFLKNDLLRLIAVSLTTIIGFLCFAFINKQFAFNFMFLRLWQFSAGFVVLFWNKISFYEYSEKLKPAKVQMVLPVEKEDLVTVSLSIIALCALPNKIDVLILRPLVTLATAFVIAGESQENQ
ncbi:hypothetical protein CAEBREN_31161, partial [Caenorhabditis brenneri]